ELALVQGEERLGGRLAVRGPDHAGGGAPAGLLARPTPELREALEAERLREAHDRRRRGVRSPRQLLGGLEGDLVEMVDDVLGHVLLLPRELVEASLDVGREGLVAGGLDRSR